MLYFLGSSAASAAVLESDKPGELPTDMPAGGGEAGVGRTLLSGSSQSQEAMPGSGLAS